MVEVLKEVQRLRSDLLLNMYNACLKAGIFNSSWKVARLVLISKGKGDLDQPSAYRPLSAAWADLCTEKDIGVLRSMQRRALLAVTSAYRRTSWEGLCVVAGALPIDIQLEKHRALFNLRRGRDASIGELAIPSSMNNAAGCVKDEAVSVWQTRWASSQKGRTTFAFFKDVRERLAAGWLRPNHFTTQVLTGHGNFKSRLLTYGVVEDERCVCGGEADTVSHFLLDCPTFDPQRECLRDIIPRECWNWPAAAPFLVSTEEAFSALSDFCEEALYLKGFLEA
ncbi:hypothetical protein ANTPLA_LOCUS2677 [Anthophora plagiata]